MKTLKDYQGRDIRLTDERLAHIIGHPFFFGTRVGDKWLCVVVKYKTEDAFVLTAYLTDRPKKGERIWPEKP